TEDCRPFSDKGDGTVLGEAVAMMALKRLEDAERDGDKIYAIITSVGSSSDGKSGSIYAPDSNGQSMAINRAYDAAGFSPQEIELVECHGTGTMAGDYAEFRGLKLAYGETHKKQYCAMGSIKSMIGHTKSAAGAASVLKVAMSLNNKVLPPTIKIDNPNPKLAIEDSPFYLNTKARPWIHETSSSRKAGVSSMGFGGTNFHVAMEEYDNQEARPKKIYVQGIELFLFSGKNSSEITSELSSFIQKTENLNIGEKAKFSQGEFVPTDHSRLAILSVDENELTKWINFVLKELEKKETNIIVNNSIYYSEEKPTNKVAFLFSGQGSQYVNMGADLLMQYDEAMDPWNHVSAMALDVNKRLNNVVYPIPVFSEVERQAQKQLLVDTKWAQPAIGVLAISHLNLLSKLKIEPTLIGGHSYGEVAALYAAGIITNEIDLVNISRKRGELMGAASKEDGAMTAIFDSELVVSEKLKTAKTSVVIANINSPSQTVVSGEKSEIEKFEKTLESSSIRFQRLNVSTAFHSELVSGSAEEFEKYLKTIKFGKPKYSVYSNTTAKQYSKSPSEYPKVLANQLAAPVQFEKQVKSMFDEGVNVFLEVGPGKVLGNFVKDILKDKPHRAISIDGGIKQNGKDAFWISMAQLSVAGIPISYNELWENVDLNKKVVSAKKPSIATVKINGSNYGKPYPPVGGYESLPKPNKEPDEISKPELPRSQPLQLKQETILKPVKQVESPISKQVALPINNTISSTPNHQKRYMNEFSDQKLRAFQEIQKNTLEAQKRFQETLAESHRIFLETSQTAFQILGGFNPNIGSVNTSTNSFKSISINDNSNHASENGAPLEKQTSPQLERKVSQPIPELKPISAAENGISESMPEERIHTPVVNSTPVVEKQSSSLPKKNDFKEVMFQIVADKTGYPKEILDLNTDLESGLGIDSIKRVEILSALQEEFPELKNVDKSKLAAMNTLGEILNYSDASSVSSPSSVSASISPISDSSEISSEKETVNTDDFKSVMFDIVAEKTGYPKEILDLETDLESGLGIDSIKRVEILSALQEVFPELKNVDKAKLAAMNTLGEILNYSDGTKASDLGGVSEFLEKK
ncbi:acyltransferase domain-containing protein, partial [Algoriphagus sp.]|uniref:acyltransferase domain-containing protein n=1 Tax=Algoriphagus sp. TaxID=1872435 RepID=UPI0025CCACD7